MYGIHIYLFCTHSQKDRVIFAYTLKVCVEMIYKLHVYIHVNNAEDRVFGDGLNDKAQKFWY